MVRTNLQTNRWRGRFFRYAPLILWIGVIFFLSSNAGSMSNTSRFIRPLLEFLFPQAPEELLLIYHGYIRKLAHVTEYAILGFWAARAFSTSGNRALQKYWHIFTLGLVLLIASLDEANQSFLTSRTSSARDVGFDFIGGTLAVCFFYILARLRRNFFKTNNEPDNTAEIL